MLLTGLALLLLTTTAEAQRRRRTKGFDLAVVLGAGLSFNGTRAFLADVQGTTCQRNADECFSQDLGSGPMFTANFEAPLGKRFGFTVGGAIGRMSRIQCTQGAQCNDRGNITDIKGNALLLFRFKPQAPIFFGFGGAVNHTDPGPVEPFQDNITITETGPTLLVGYDFALGSKVGARIAWWSYWFSPQDDNLPSTGFKTPGSSYDTVVSISARILLNR